MKTFLSTLTCCLLLAFLQAQPKEKITLALGQQIIPVHSLSPKGAADAFDQMKPYLEGVEILGLGEGTHGTHEFFAFKHQMIRYAVENLRYKVVAFEAPFDLHKPNAYIQGGDMGLWEAIVGMEWGIWQTQEVSDLLAWLRTYNLSQEPEERVQLVGIDMQGLHSAHYWQEIREEYNIELTPEIRNLLSYLSSVSLYGLPKHTVSELDSLLEDARLLRKWVRENEPKLMADLGEKKAVFAIRHAEVLIQTIRRYLMYNQNLKGQYNFRDSCMAANVMWLKEVVFPSEKILIWAHNAHVCHLSENFGPFSPDHKLMGWHLKQALDTAYYSLGMGFAHGSFLSRDPKGLVQEFTVAPPPKGSLPWHLAATETSMAMFDWKSLLQTPELRKWGMKKHAYRALGAGYDSKYAHKYFTKDHPAYTHFDGWFFVKNATAARPLPFVDFSFYLPEKELRGDSIQLRFLLRSPKQIQGVPSVSLSALSERLNLLVQGAERVEKKEGWQEYTIAVRIPLETEVLYTYVRWMDCAEVEVDEISLLHFGGDGKWESLLDWDVNFEQGGEEKLKLGPGKTAERDARSAYVGNYGLRIKLAKSGD